MRNSEIGDGQAGRPASPTLLAQRQLPRPIAFTRLRGTDGSVAAAASGGPDAAFMLMVAVAPSSAGTVRVGGVESALPAMAPGDTLVLDLRTAPEASFSGAHDVVQVHIPAATLDRLADQDGAPRVRGLRPTLEPVRDPVMNGLALSLLPALEAPQAAAGRFLDGIALAFHAHAARRYGCGPAGLGSDELGKAGPGRSGAGKGGQGLAPWQLRRVTAYADAHLDRDLCVGDLAAECRLSSSHFARAFAASTGSPPYQWLLSRRIARAKELLLGTGQELSQVALACGFVDQSHFTRVFTRAEGQSPGRWRRQHRH